MELKDNSEGEISTVYTEYREKKIYKNPTSYTTNNCLKMQVLIGLWHFMKKMINKAKSETIPL